MVYFVSSHLASSDLHQHCSTQHQLRSHGYTWLEVRVLPEYIIVPLDLDNIYHPPKMYLPISCIDFLESEVPYSVVRICHKKEFAWRAHPQLLPQDDHWFSFTDLFNPFRQKYILSYQLYVIFFTTFGNLSSCKESLGVCVLVRWGEGKKVCLLEGILGNVSGWNFECLPCFNKDGIHWGSSSSSLLH